MKADLSPHGLRQGWYVGVGQLQDEVTTVASRLAESSVPCLVVTSGTSAVAVMLAGESAQVMTDVVRSNWPDAETVRTVSDFRRVVHRDMSALSRARPEPEKGWPGALTGCSVVTVTRRGQPQAIFVTRAHVGSFAYFGVISTRNASRLVSAWERPNPHPHARWPPR